MLIFFITSLPPSSTSLNIFLISQHLFHIFFNMAYMLTPVKTAIVEFSKSFPNIAMAKEIDFET
jgi:hypothetical protein